jgi:hypothetical protein
MATVISLELKVPETKFVEAFRRLPPLQRAELLERLRALCEPELRTVPASRLHALTGLVSLGGDALADTEAIYDGDTGY